MTSLDKRTSLNYITKKAPSPAAELDTQEAQGCH